MQFSKELEARPEFLNSASRDRILLGMQRIQNVLNLEIVSVLKTLEQKISDAGPTNQRIDPHLLTLGLSELTSSKRILIHNHSSTGGAKWYANAKTKEVKVLEKLDAVAPLYSEIRRGNAVRLIGQALEVVTYKSLLKLRDNLPGIDILGSIDFEKIHPTNQAYKKIEPPNILSGRKTSGLVDFVITGLPNASVCVECKNYREWVYPTNPNIIDLVKKALVWDAVPLLIARRFHYTTLTNFFEPAGILAHQTYNQFYPVKFSELASKVSEKRSLGFFDVKSTEDSIPKMEKFLIEILPSLTEIASIKFRENKSALEDYVAEDINLAQLYNAIGSRASPKWVDYSDFSNEPF